MIRLPLLAASAWALLCLLRPAGAEVQRLAFLVGMNRGLDDERPLRYASRDAREMSALLRRSGAFDKDRIYLLADEGLDRVKASLAEVAGRVKEIRRGGTQTLVLFYYSGHGSASALHIGGKRWPREEVNKAVEELGSDLKIVILDACESGDFLRSKGGRVLEGNGVRVEDSLGSRGTLVLTSSSRGELSQESENYRGAIFSHHLMNGMRGMADYDRNRAVTVLEAFDYARETTRLEHIGGRDPAQNPAFDLDLVGREDPVLTRIPTGLSHLTLLGMPWAPLEIYDAASLDLVYRVWLTGKDSLAFTLPAGKYVLCLHHKSYLMSRSVDMSWEREVAADLGSFRKHPKHTLYEKGGRAILWNPHGLRLGVSRAELMAGLAMPLYQAGYEYRGYRLQHAFEAGWGSGTLEGAEFDNAVNVFRAGYSLKAAWMRWRLGQATVGLAGTYEQAFQEVTDKRFPTPIGSDDGDVPLQRDFSARLWRLSAPLEHELHLPGGIWFSAGIAGGWYLFRDRAEDEHVLRFEWTPVAGFGYRF